MMILPASRGGATCAWTTSKGAASCMRHEAELHRKEVEEQDVQLVREEQGSRSGSKGSGGLVKAGIGRGGVGGRVPT